jgi:hypothetical protein
MRLTVLGAGPMFLDGADPYPGPYIPNGLYF